MKDERRAVRAQRLNEVFGGMRAEYFRDDIFELFTQPRYWPELLTRRPCLLVGGRGTGKTTVLRGLSYEGQARLDSPTIEEWNHVGLYWRIDTNVVRAFSGSTIAEQGWARIFAHYVNMTLAQLLLDFVRWVADSGQAEVDLDPSELRRCSRSLNLVEKAGGIDGMSESLEDAVVDFEFAINNIDSLDVLPPLSVLGRPISHLCSAITNDGRFQNKKFFFLVDEYENFEDYQQRVFNTLVKHAGDDVYTFKIGMKATGHRERATINPDEILVEPADYALIDISERLKKEDFSEFAKSVCVGRLSRLSTDLGSLQSVEALFPSLSEEREAELLGVREHVRGIRGSLVTAGATGEELDAFDQMTPLTAYMVKYWADSQGIPPIDVLRFAISQSAKWATRVTNYQHAALYTIRKGRRGISKFYAGWSTYVLLSDGNIRYLLQLVNEALQNHLTENLTLADAVSVQVQTQAAQAVGRRLVEQLQGLSTQGADLTRLVLGLGRIFQVMAAFPEGHTPEVSQFRVQPSKVEPFDKCAEDILGAAVMHLAVRRFPGDKMAAASGETRDFVYQLHPMFAPFFVFSHRSKRRMEVTTRDIHGIVHDPRKSIHDILGRSNRLVPEQLPEQMSLFQEYFG